MCDSIFISDYQLANHALQVHKKQKNILCNACDITFASNFSLKRHIEKLDKNHIEFLISQ